MNDEEKEELLRKSFTSGPEGLTGLPPWSIGMLELRLQFNNIQHDLLSLKEEVERLKKVSARQGLHPIPS